MLILPQLTEVKIVSRNNRHYKDLGYNVKNGDIITTDVTKMSKGSHIKVKFFCDICGSIEEREYKQYLLCYDSENDMDFCNKCKVIRYKNNSLKKYGVDSPMKLDEIKEKRNQSLIEKYGTYKVSSLPEIREKIKSTCLEKYGTENAMQSKEIKERIKKTCLEKYGVESSLQLETTRKKMKDYFRENFDEITKKRENTNLKKYGCKNPFENEEIKEKIKKTNIEKYGVEYASQSKEIKEKVRQTCLERYGTENVLQNKEIKEKVRQTCLERYGVESSLQLPKVKLRKKEYFVSHKEEIIKKSRETLKRNGRIPTSSQQIYIYNCLKEQYENVELNYSLNCFSLDIALFVFNKKIDIEYDGWYWHQDKQKDRRRDEVVKSNGWVVLRIKSGNKVPTTESLIEKINYIIKNDVKYSEIVLDDWKEAV